MDNPFDRCNSDAEVMKMVFELSATGKYSRQQLNVMAASRREELKSSTVVSDINAIKVYIPVEDSFKRVEPSQCKVFITKDFRTTGKFEFLCGGFVRF